ncbi:MAG: polyprenol monophosphomannose synthase [Chitinophagales bacterium]|nr:polyprenol monophosphomannose synthase [Chitinophagales bacterium]MDW8273372.1 polyprenol monophosphomannose synthase [Chitinophagales bacterium]
MVPNIVIIPTYNERGNIEKMIHKVMSLSPQFNLLIVDDSSPDGTAHIVRNLQSIYPERLFLIERAGKLGLGTAYIVGFKWALERGYEYIFEMDCDFSHNPDDLIRLLEEAHKGYDLVIGSRYVKGGGFRNWPMSRILLSRVASLYVNVVTWIGIADTTAGFVCFHRKVLESIDLDRIKFIGYTFQIEMKYAARQLGFRIKEIPIIFTERVEGVSKMSANIIKEAIGGVLSIRWNSLFRSYRRRVD